MDEAKTTPSCLGNPLLSRLYACKAIVNTLSLGLQADRHSLNPSSYQSRFLSEPVPEIQVEALSLACQAIFLLHQTKELSTSNAKVMLSVILTVLDILSQISVTAAFVVKSLQEMSDKNGIDMSHEDLHVFQRAVFDPESTLDLSLCDREFIDGFSQEMNIQVHADSSMIDRLIQKYETEIGPQGWARNDPTDDVTCFILGEGTSIISKPRSVNLAFLHTNFLTIRFTRKINLTIVHSDISDISGILDAMDHSYMTPEESDSFLEV